MKTKQTIVTFMALFGFVAMPALAPQTALAKCGGVETSVVNCAQTNDPKKGVQGNAAWGVLLIAINILTAGVGVAAVGGLTYAGIIYATASNDQAKIVKAKETIYNVVLGIVMYALMWSFIQYLVPGGVFK